METMRSKWTRLLEYNPGLSSRFKVTENKHLEYLARATEVETLRSNMDALN